MKERTKMINKELIEKLNQKIIDSENKYIEYMNMGHIEAEKIKKAKARLLEVNKVIDYRGFECIVKIDNIKHLSEVYKVDGKHEIYIVISDKLSNSDANKELEYAINNLLPGVVDKILYQEQLEFELDKKKIQEYEEQLKKFKINSITFDDVKLLYHKAEYKIAINGIGDIIDSLMGSFDSQYSDFVKLNVLFNLGIMEGKRQERARRKGAAMIG